MSECTYKIEYINTSYGFIHTDDKQYIVLILNIIIHLCMLKIQNNWCNDIIIINIILWLGSHIAPNKVCWTLHIQQHILGDTPYPRQSSVNTIYPQICFLPSLFRKKRAWWIPIATVWFLPSLFSKKRFWGTHNIPGLVFSKKRVWGHPISPVWFLLSIFSKKRVWWTPNIPVWFLPSFFYKKAAILSCIPFLWICKIIAKMI